MIKKSKKVHGGVLEEAEVSPKKLKKSPVSVSSQSELKQAKKSPTNKPKTEKGKNIREEKPQKKDGKFKNHIGKKGKPFPNKNTRPNADGNSDKTNWTEFKKKKKELRAKRKQSKELYDVIVEAKKIAELLRQKHLKGGKDERNKLVADLYNLLEGKECYAKLVLSHDTSRIVQYLLKFGAENMRKEVSLELIPLSVEMLLSKYGRYCLKSMLKYGNGNTRSASINAMYGNAVKLTSHVVSASVFEYAYSTWASPQQKHHLIQEFFGDMYKKTKDDQVKHLKDVYKDSLDMKAAAFSATKANLLKILNKNLLDSTLIQSVLHQYLTECSAEDRTELISQLASHVVILSNSKDGTRVAMDCIWHGSNKDRKTAMKAIKEHAIDLSKHECGHCTVIALLDAADDTVLVNKMIIGQLLENAKDLAANEWGRKVLLWLIAPADLTHFHPTFIKELEAGRTISTSKKSPDVRRTELLQYSRPDLLKSVASDSHFWLSTASIAVITLAILKSSSTYDKGEALQEVVKTITDPEWKIKEEESEMLGIEHPGLHMILKKLAQHDKVLDSASCMTFGKILLSTIADKTIKLWLTLNRGCFLLVTVYENGSDDVQQQIKLKLNSHRSLLKKQTGPGAQILLKKLH